MAPGLTGFMKWIPQVCLSLSWVTRCLCLVVVHWRRDVCLSSRSVTLTRGSRPEVCSKTCKDSEVLCLQIIFRIVPSHPEVADGCRFGPCASTSISRGLMSLTWAIKQTVASRSWEPNFGVRVLGPCPCASQISWLVAVYEYLGRSRATASGPCPCAGR